ncbi:MAG TPA: YrbL family protein, partial [Sphingomicrobium sp.]|nr:YrbL family protein [Sphingomicrobium sp.]
MSETIKLAGVTPLASGGRRLVFSHPDDPRLIIKVLQKSYIKRLIPNPENWRQKRKRYKQYITYLQEAREHLAAYAACGERPKHMQNLVGFAGTDYGPG